MSTTSFAPRKLKTELARSFYRDVVNENDFFHVFFGRFVTAILDDRSVDSKSHLNMYAIKRIKSSDVVYIIPNVTWTTGTIYDRYDDDIDLATMPHNFYVYNDINNCIYKCLNRQDFIDGSAVVPSTARPSESVSTEKFQTLDGYWWKLIYSIPIADVEKYVTPTYLPVRYTPSSDIFDTCGIVSNITVTNAGDGYLTLPLVIIGGDGKGAYATAQINDFGEVVSIDVKEGGSGYSFVKVDVVTNDPTGTGATATADLVGPTPPVALNVNIATAAQATAGAIEFVDVVDAGSAYSQNTTFKVVGDGTGATVDITVNDAGGITKMVVSNAGKGYTFADIVLNEGSGNGAHFNPIISPYFGHGGNVPSELLSTMIGVVVDVESSLSDFFWTNTIRQVGIVKNVRAYGAYGDIFKEDTGDASYKVLVSDVGNYNINDTITTDGGGEFVVVETNSNLPVSEWPFVDSGLTAFRDPSNVVKLLPLIDILNNTSVLTNVTTSGSLATPISILPPEINKKGGDIIFIKNTPRYTLQKDQTETVKLYLQF